MEKIIHVYILYFIIIYIYTQLSFIIIKYNAYTDTYAYKLLDFIII